MLKNKNNLNRYLLRLFLLYYFFPFNFLYTLAFATKSLKSSAISIRRLPFILALRSFLFAFFIILLYINDSSLVTISICTYIYYFIQKTFFYTLLNFSYIKIIYIRFFYLYKTKLQHMLELCFILFFIFCFNN